MFHVIWLALTRVILRIFFREYSVVGLQGVPESGPLLIIANHTNALVDPLVVMIVLKRHISATAKSVLQQNPLLRLLIWGNDWIVFHRPQDRDKGADMRQNRSSFDVCIERLATGDAVLIFPEGLSHSDPQMRPFKTGAARIALEYQAAHPAGPDMAVVPVGLYYTDKRRFRSGVLVHFGAPLAMRDWMSGHSGEPEPARALTAEFERLLREVTLNVATDHASAVIGWAARMLLSVQRGQPELGHALADPAEAFRLSMRLAQGYRKLQESHAGLLADLEARMLAYQERLTRMGIEPAEVQATYTVWRSALFVLRELEIIVIGSPIAAWGTLNNTLPYRTVDAIANRISSDPDHWASHKVYPAKVVYPLFYALQTTAVGLTFGVVAALAYLAVLPYASYYALLYLERVQDCEVRVRTFFRLWRDPQLHRELRDEARAIVTLIHDLGDRVGVSGTV